MLNVEKGSCKTQVVFNCRFITVSLPLLLVAYDGNLVESNNSSSVNLLHIWTGPFKPVKKTEKSISDLFNVNSILFVNELLYINVFHITGFFILMFDFSTLVLI